MRPNLNQALSRSLTRRQFLLHLGAVALAVIGIPAILRALELGESASPSDSYGGSSYGGNRPPHR